MVPMASRDIVPQAKIVRIQGRRGVRCRFAGWLIVAHCNEKMQGGSKLGWEQECRTTSENQVQCAHCLPAYYEISEVHDVAQSLR